MSTLSLRSKRRLARRITHSRIARALAARVQNRRGDRLDAQLALILWLDRVLGGEKAGLSVSRRRSDMRDGTWVAAGDPVGVSVREGEVGNPPLPVRYYEPEGAAAALVFLHGGGWVVGDLDTHDVLCRRLAVGSNRLVVAVDYPLAPESRWPAPVHSVVEAFRVLHNELGQRFEHIAIGGDSAGGNLATNACRLLREGGPLPELQLLIYPGLDATLSAESHTEFAEGFMLTEESVKWYLETYGPDPQHPLGSPGLAPDLDGLPRAVIAVAGFDPLRDEGLLYAERLREVGIAVDLHDFGTMIHGFANMDGLCDAAGAHIDTLAAAIRH